MKVKSNCFWNGSSLSCKSELVASSVSLSHRRCLSLSLCSSSRSSTLHHAGDSALVSDYSVYAASAASCCSGSILECLNNTVFQNSDRKHFLFLLVQISVLLSVFASPHLPDHPHLSSMSPNTGLYPPQVFTKLVARFFAPVFVMMYFLFTRPLLYHESAFLSAASPHHHILKISPFCFFSLTNYMCLHSRPCI